MQLAFFIIASETDRYLFTYKYVNLKKIAPDTFVIYFGRN